MVSGMEVIISFQKRYTRRAVDDLPKTLNFNPNNKGEFFIFFDLKKVAYPFPSVCCEKSACTSLLKREVLLFVAEGTGGEGVRREACFVLRQEGSKKIYAEKQKSYWTFLLKRGILPVYLSVIMYIVQ